jgi:hypothetical protein
MIDYVKTSQEFGGSTSATERRRLIATILILIVDLGVVA